MEKTIYNVYVLMENQEQYFKMLNLCKLNDLPCDSSYLLTNLFKYFRYRIELEGFGYNEFSLSENTNNFTQVTESEFIELLKTTK